MTGTIAQIVALICYGNHYLMAREIDSEFYSNNSAFQYCKRVDFWNVCRSTGNTQLICAGPAEWFEYLRLSGASHLRFKYARDPDPRIDGHMMAGLVGGGGSWLIEELLGEECIEWSHHWRVTQEDSPENKIWSVSYHANPGLRDATDNPIPLELSRRRLDRSLREMSRFAASNGMGWVDHFETALRALTCPTPEVGYYHQDLLIPHSYSLGHRQLFYAAALAWCFGGMGSWNDVWLDSEDLRIRHQQVSRELFDAINQSLATVLS